MVTDYFQCKRGCVYCCPGFPIQETGSLPFRVIDLTIGDVDRTFKYNNPDRLSFSELFEARFDFYYRKGSRRLSEAEQSLADMGVKVFSKFDTFYVSPISKGQCSNLLEDGCRAHNTISKYLACITRPEGYLLDGPIPETDYVDSDLWEMFMCTQEKVIKPEEEAKIRALLPIFDTEREITIDLFPKIGMPVGETDCWIGELNGHEELRDELMEIVKSFDIPENRVWEVRINETTRQIADILGIELE